MKIKKIFILSILCLTFVLGLPQKTFASENTTAKACVVFEANSGRLLFEKNKEQKLPEASTTKIMTALIVAENADINEVVVISKQATGIEGSSIYLREGEKLTVKELLYGLMLRSGNDCAVALALHVGKTIENFANMMNEKAKSLGCKNTNFTNPHGLPDDNHYTCAYDLGLISCNAIKNPIVREVVSAKSVKINNDGYDYPRYLKNKNKILTIYNYSGANGIKTGFTKKAGRCFVASAERDGMQLVVVLLNCGPMFEESMQLMDFFFEQYEMKNLLQIKDIFHTIKVKKGKNKFVEAKAENRFYYPLKKDGSENDKVKIVSTLQNQVDNAKPGQIVGKTQIMFDNQLIFSSKIITLNII
ncbi:MAG: D-alanyl-D-alanine carboxypeptidase [Clostridia bacterium]|nr:D-alanyl-D-alanine carboxypeptidase [Clostridia bacterium]